MKKDLYHQIRICLSLVLCATFTGCIKDDLSDCPTGTYRIVVQTDARDKVVSGDIKEVYLFLFDENNRYLDAKAVSLNNVIELQYPGHSVLQAVAWANTKSGLQKISPAAEGLSLDNGTVELIDTESKAESGYSKSPDDLFHGLKSLDMTKDTSKEPEVVTIKRKVAGITIKAKHLKEYTEWVTGSPGESTDYYYVVRSNSNTINFYGSLTGSNTKYLPSSSFNNNNEFVSPTFCLWLLFFLSLTRTKSPLRIIFFFSYTVFDFFADPIHLFDCLCIKKL